MMVDSSILVHAANRASTSQAAARAFLKTLIEGQKPWYLSWNVMYDFLRIVTDGAIFYEPFRMEEAIDFMKGLRKSSSLKLLQETEGHAAALEEFMRTVPEVKSADFRIIHTAALMKEHALTEIAAATMEYRRFPGLKVVNPLGR